MLKVWSDNQPAGVLGRNGARGATFAYAPDAEPARAVSVTMPVRLASWDMSFGLHPIFEMNLPEGFLRERLRRDFAKITGHFDEMDLLGIVGRAQVARLRYTAEDAELDDEVPFQSVDEILKSRREGDLFAYLLDRFSRYSGVAGVQPKVLIRDEGEAEALQDRQSASVRAATHIVKFWDPAEYPQLAANEFFALEVTAAAGLKVPRHRLSDDGRALVVDRFDLAPDGTYLGFEDFCVLNGRRAEDKYNGSAEVMLFRRLQSMAPGDRRQVEAMFLLFVVNCALRNGDAHLKNFGMLYDDVRGAMTLAPAYDILTTTVYVPKDAMALTLGGTTRWPDRKRLLELGTVRCAIQPKRVGEIFEAVASAIDQVSGMVRDYIVGHPEFEEVGRRMLGEWESGVRETLGL